MHEIRQRDGRRFHQPSPGVRPVRHVDPRGGLLEIHARMCELKNEENESFFEVPSDISFSTDPLNIGKITIETIR